MIDWQTFGQRKKIVTKMGDITTEMGGNVLGPIQTEEFYFTPELTDDEAKKLTDEGGVTWVDNDPKQTGSAMKYRTVFQGKRFYSNYEPEKPKPKEKTVFHKQSESKKKHG